MPNAAYLLIGLAVLVLVIVRQTRVRRIDRGRKLWITPLVLAVISFDGGLLDPRHRLFSAAFLAVSGVLALATGVLRGVTVRVWRDIEGVLWTQGTRWTLAAWVLSIALRAGVEGAQYLAGLPLRYNTFVLFLALTLAGQNAVVAWRAGLAAQVYRSLVPAAPNEHAGSRP